MKELRCVEKTPKGVCNKLLLKYEGVISNVEIKCSGCGKIVKVNKK